MKLSEYRNRTQSQSWLVEPLIGSGHNVLIFGKQGSGKTTFAWEIARAVASGTPVVGSFQTKQGKVLIIDEETPESDFQQRMLKTFGHDVNTLDNIECWPRPESGGFRFDNTLMGTLISKVEEEPPDVIIIDNLNATQGNLKVEESNASVSIIRHSFTRLRDANPDMVIILIHHEGKDETKGARGSSAILDMADSAIQIKRIWDNPFQFAVKQLPRKRPATLKPFVIELKDDGKQLQLEYRGEEEQINLPEHEETILFECFLLIQGNNKSAEERTVYEIKKHLQGRMSDHTIRESAKVLEKNGALAVGHKRHNLAYYWLPKSITMNTYCRALLGEMQKKGGINKTTNLNNLENYTFY